jgi:hypothetical protein
MVKVKQEQSTEPPFILSTEEKGHFRESVLGEPEPWEPWETKLCLWSLGIGIVTLLVLGFLINQFLL